MVTKQSLEAINTSGESYFGYLEMAAYDCPPFVMFVNNLDCPVCHQYLVAKTFEPESLRLWCNLVRGASAVLDIGAQGGIYSLAAAALRSDMSIHAFEPNPDGHARLLINIAANDFKNITPHRTALGAQSGLVEFGWVSKGIGHISSGGKVAGYLHPTAVKVAAYLTTLDAAVEKIDLGRAPILKIDVEGYERHVFTGAQRVLALTPDIILETFSQKNCDVIAATIEPLGYRCYLINEVERRLEPRDRLAPADPRGSMNQFLSVRPQAEVLALG